MVCPIYDGNISRINNQLDMTELYTTESLLNRFYTQVAEKMQQSSSVSINALKVKSENKKTYISEFTKLCAELNRPQLEVMNYIRDELQASISISEKGDAVVIGMYKQHKINEKVKKYIEEHVMCSQCKSLNTEIKKIDRVHTMCCNKCSAKRSL